MAKHMTANMSVQALKPLEGKLVRISGMVRTRTYLKKKWPEVVLKDRTSIVELK